MSIEVTEQDVTVPVTATWTGKSWSLTYLNPCTYCGRRHIHGGGNDPAGPNLREGDAWGSHCIAGHRRFGPTCVIERGTARCGITHLHMATLREPTSLEVELASSRPHKVRVA